MTMQKIVDGLELLVLQLANDETRKPDDWTDAEWAYLKGVASGFILKHVALSKARD